MICAITIGVPEVTTLMRLSVPPASTGATVRLSML